MHMLHYLCFTMFTYTLYMFMKCTYKKLRILASYEGKTAKNDNFWTFWPVIQLINHHLSDFEKMAY